MQYAFLGAVAVFAISLLIIQRVARLDGNIVACVAIGGLFMAFLDAFYLVAGGWWVLS